MTEQPRIVWHNGERVVLVDGQMYSYFEMTDPDQPAPVGTRVVWATDETTGEERECCLGMKHLGSCDSTCEGDCCQ